jgi:uncharacterized protein (TIGR00299 family) protein
VIGWLDCGSGASGDMLLGALLDAGVPLEVVAEAIAAVSPEPVTVETSRVTRAGFTAVRAHVRAADSAVHRTWPDVRALLDVAPLDAHVRERARASFARLATAEAAVHGRAPDEVHFHEVGALDAIADVVGVCAALAHLDLSVLHASPVAVGAGRVHTAHGSLPVPPPAVAELLRGIPSYGGPVEEELCTPTGAALLAEWVTAWGPQPAMVGEVVGVGAGGHDPPGHPNALRLMLGDAAAATAAEAQVTGAPLLLECNVDDLDPRLWPAVLAQLLEVGASDAWLTPILMKKGRPAHTLSVLVASERAEEVRAEIFTETTTLGLRETSVRKHALERRAATVEINGILVEVKLGVLDGRVVNAQPEYDHVAAVAAATGRPLKSVLASAIALARALW